MIDNNLQPFPVLETNRFILRQIIRQDVQDMFDFRSNENAMKYISRPIAKKLEDVLGVIDLMERLLESQQAINWGICYKENNKIIGTIAYMNIDKANSRAEIGYMLHPNYHRQGMMQEVLETIIQFGFQQFKLHSIYANVHPDNTASNSILLKNGFVKEAHLKENYFYDGEFLDTVIFGLLNKL